MLPSKISAFISYASQDKDISRRLAYDLRSAGIEIWYDEFQLRAGDPILHSIRTGIERSDVLLALISKHSITSKWVDKEVRDAFGKHGVTGAPAIIPIRLDDSEPPSFLRSVKWIDFRTDYDEGLRELLDALRSRRPSDKAGGVIDVRGLAEELAKDRAPARGAGAYATTVLSLATIVATLITAAPAFYQVFAEPTKLYYSIDQGRLSIPPAVDSEKLRKMLRAEGIADSSIRIQLVNRGRKAAEEIKVGVAVEGSLSAFASTPDAATNPVWVTIVPPVVKPNDASANLMLRKLVPNRAFSATYTYASESGNFKCDVVVDGVLAKQVQDINALPEWPVWNAIKTPASVFVFGFLVSVIAGVYLASLTNEKVRELVVDILDVVAPMVGRFARHLWK
jgi:hypothetical protein